MTERTDRRTNPPDGCLRILATNDVFTQVGTELAPNFWNHLFGHPFFATHFFFSLMFPSLMGTLRKILLLSTCVLGLGVVFTGESWLVGGALTGSCGLWAVTLLGS